MIDMSDEHRGPSEPIPGSDHYYLDCWCEPEVLVVYAHEGDAP